MTKSKEVKEQVTPVAQPYSKEAFVDAAEEGKEKLILQVALKDGQSYTKEAAAEIVTAWKTREVR